MSEYKLFNRWNVKKKTFWWVVGGSVGSIAILSMLVVLVAGIPFMGSMSYGNSDEYFDNGMDDSISSTVSNSAGAPEMAKSMFAEKSADFAPQAFDGEISNTSASERMIIREGNITVKVDSTRNSQVAIKALVSSMSDKGAYIVSSNEYAYYDGQEPNITIVIRIPVDQFDFVIDEISDMAEGNFTINTWSDDVSEQYNDLESRLESLEAARLRLLDIMQNADTTEDLLAAEQQLTYRESEIESIKGSMQYLSQSSDLSRIYIYLEPYILSQPIDTKWTPSETIRYAIEELLESLQDFADWIIVFVIATLPWLIIIGLVVWLVVRKVKKNKTKKSE